MISRRCPKPWARARRTSRDAFARATMPRPRTAFASAAAATIAACLTFARPTAALVFAEPRDLRAEGPPRPSERGDERGVALVDRLSAHALAADAADAAAEALHLPLSTGTRFDAQSLSSSPDLRVGARHARPRLSLIHI